jgi:hypothetical protein
MRAAALVVAPVVVLALVHLLQRLEVWATDTSPRTTGRSTTGRSTTGRSTTGRRQAVGHLDATVTAPSLRQTPVSRRRREGEASDHG